MTDKNENQELAKRHASTTAQIFPGGFTFTQEGIEAFAAALEERHHEEHAHALMIERSEKEQLQAQIAMLVDALKDAADEYRKLPHSLGYRITHTPRWDKLVHATQQSSEAFLAEVRAKALEDAAEECLILDGDDCDDGFANQYDCSNHLKRLAAELRNSAAQGKEGGE